MTPRPTRFDPAYTPQRFHAMQAGMLPDLLGLRIDTVAEGAVVLSLDARTSHLAPNGFLHAASVVALADTAAGYGCVAHLPEGAQGFTTLELKSNFLGTRTDGTIVATATLLHAGRQTQIWDAVVRDAGARTLALFRCTQMVLWPQR